MTSITASLDAAAQQILDLLQQLSLSNCRFVQGPDEGSVNAIVVNPTSPVTEYGPDLVVLVDVAHPNTNTTVSLNVSSIGAIPVTTSTGQPPAVGSIAGKCMFGISPSGSNGWVARCLSEDYSNFATLAQLEALLPVVEQNGGLGVVNGNQWRLLFNNLPEAESPATGDTIPYRANGVESFMTLETLIQFVLGAASFGATPQDFAGFTLSQAYAIPNATSTVLPLTGFTPPFGVGGPNGFTFEEDGLFVVDIQISLQISTSNSTSGAPVSQARVYGAVSANLTPNGTTNPIQIFNGNQAGSANNYIAVLAYTGSFSRYYSKGDVITIFGYGTGDSFQSGSVNFVGPTTFNITRIL